MSKNEVINITLKTNMDIGDIKSKTSAIQGTLSKLKLSDSMSGKFDKLFSGLDTELSKVQEKMNSAFKTKSDVTGFEKSVNKVASMFTELNQEISKIGDKDLRKSLTLDTTEIQRAKERVSELQKEISKKIDASGFKEVEKAINDMASKSKFKTDFGTAFKLGDVEGAKTALGGLLQNLKTFTSTSDEMKAKIGTIFDDLINGDSQKAEQAFTGLRAEIERLDGADGLKSTAANMEILFSKFNELKKVDLNTLRVELEKAGIEVQNLSNTQLDKLAQEIKDAAAQSKGLEQGLRQSGNAAVAAADDMYSLNNQMNQVRNRVQDFFSLTNSVMLFRRAIRQAFETVKELDAAMTETAVVTDFNVGDMWDQLPQYTKAANDLGTTTLGAYETMTLFYQQGLKTNEVFEIGTETMKMARIAGLEYKDATDLMTAALRGFNMELNETSAARVNDVYSELAAITAADTQEIATAMTKTASIAANANMEFETTAAFLSQIIETTREPAETAGTAMKTIIARFTEMKKAESDLVDVDGETISVNKVEAALKTAGVALRDFNGEFRDTDDVFLELASKWNGLDKMTQRYIATMAAGSRQQSRFIAMMSDYDRTVELVDAAYSSAGASQNQFAKTQESLESKLNKLKNAWDEFVMGLANSSIIKAGVDLLTKLINAVNKLTGLLGEGAGGVAKFAIAFGALKGGGAIFNSLLKSFSPLVKNLSGEGEKAATGFIAGLTQRINNFKMGKAFVLDADVNTKGINNKFNQIKANWLGLGQSITKPYIPTGTITGFEILNGKLVSTAITAEGSTETIEAGLSQVSLKAFYAAMAADEVGDEILESGISGKVALDILQKEYDELIARQLLARKLGKTQRADNLGNQADSIQGLMDQIKEGKGKNPSKSLGKALKDAFGKGIKGVKGFLSTLAPIAPLLAVLAAEIGLIWAAWYFSPENILKRQIEDAIASAEKAQEVFEDIKSDLDELTSSQENLASMTEEFEDMAKGTSKWREQLANINTEVLKLMRTYPELAKYLTYGENGEMQISEEGWEEVLNKQREYVVNAETAATVSQVRVQQLESELDYTQKLERKQDEIAKGWNEGAGIGVGTVVGSGLGILGAGAGAAIGIGSVLTGAVTGAMAGSVIPIAGTIIGALVGIAGGVMAGLATNEGVKNATENSEEYQKYQEELDEQKKAEREARLQQYTSILYSNLSTEEELKDNQNLQVASELMNQKFEANLINTSNEMGLSDWTKDGASKEEIAQWAEKMGYTYKDNKIYDKSGELVYKIEMSGDAHEGEEGWITNEQIAQQLAAITAEEKTEEQTKELLKTMTQVENKLGLDEGGFSDLFYEEDLGGSQIRQLMKTNINDIATQLDEMSILTGQDMRYLLALKKAQAEQYYTQMNQEMATSALFYADTLPTNKEFNIKEYQAEFDEWIEKNLSDIQYEKILDQYKGIKETLGFSAAGIYIDALREGNVEIDAFQGVLDNVDFSNPISAYADLKRVSEQTRDAIKETTDKIIETGKSSNKIDKGSQWRYFFNSEEFAEVNKSLEEIRDTGKQITADNIYELADSNKLLREMLNSSSAGAQSLLTAIEGLNNGLLTVSDLTNNFVEALSELNALADLTAKAFYTIDNLNISRSSTEISKFWSDSKKEILELYEMGAYGDQRLIDYMVSMLGQENWDKILTKAEETGGGYKEAMSKYMTQITNDSFSMYSDWVRAAKELNYVTMSGSGAILFDFKALGNEITNTDELIAHMAKTLGLSESYVEAMIVDMGTFSSTFQKNYQEWSGDSGLKTLLEGAGTFTSNGNTYLNVTRRQLEYVVDNVDEFVEKFNKLGDIKIDLSKSLTVSGTELSKELQDIIDNDLLKLSKLKVKVVVDKEEIEKELVKIDNKSFDFADEKSFFMAANSMYQHLLGAGMIESDARAALEAAFSDPYEVKINGEKITPQVLSGVLDGVQNDMITIASVEQAEVIANIYYKAIYKAISLAIQRTLGNMPGYQQFVFYDGAGKAYYTNTSPNQEGSEWGKKQVLYNPGSKLTYDISQWTKQKDGTYKTTEVNEVYKTSTEYVYDPKNNIITVTNSSLAGPDVVGEIPVKSVTQYTITATDKEGNKVTQTYIDDGSGSFKGVYLNPQSPINTLDPNDAGDLGTPVSDDMKRDLLGLDKNTTGEMLEKQWKEYIKNNKTDITSSTSAYTSSGSRVPFDTDSGKGSEKDEENPYIDKKIKVNEREAENAQERINILKEEESNIESAIGAMEDKKIKDYSKIAHLQEEQLKVKKQYLQELEEEAKVQEALVAQYRAVVDNNFQEYLYIDEETGAIQKTSAYAELDEDDEAQSNLKKNIDEIIDSYQQAAERYNENLWETFERESEIEELEEGPYRDYKPTEQQQAEYDKQLQEAKDTNKAAEELIEQKVKEFEEIAGKYSKEIADALVLDTEKMQYEIDQAKYNQLTPEQQAVVNQAQTDYNTAWSSLMSANEEGNKAHDNLSDIKGKRPDTYGDIDNLNATQELEASQRRQAKNEKILAELSNDRYKNYALMYVMLGKNMKEQAKSLKAEQEQANVAKARLETFKDDAKVQEYLKEGLIEWSEKDQTFYLNEEKVQGHTEENTINKVYEEGIELAGNKNKEEDEVFDASMKLWASFEQGINMIEQILAKIEEFIGYITQATQVIVDAWTNREDYLYNFLQIVEKELREYERLQRYSAQIEKGRAASVEDIRKNWNQQWKSLQSQLEEQEFRLEQRQKQLNMSRLNPFQFISGWDPSSDTLYENRTMKLVWDAAIGAASAFLPMGLGAFAEQLNQLYEDYDSRVQEAYEDRIAAEEAIAQIEDERLELVKFGSEEATSFEQQVLDALIQKEQEQIDELSRLNDSITDANSKLISTLQNNLEKIRQDRENEKKEEELGEKERRLAYLRQDTSGANMMEIKKLEEELEEGHEDYTDTLIDQKISELQEQNDKAAEQRQQQIDLLQAQLEWNKKYGLYWDSIYGMLYTFDEKGMPILNPENFTEEGNIRENSQIAKLLGTFSDTIGMSVWSQVLANEEANRLAKYYGFFIGENGVFGEWTKRFAINDPSADDPSYVYPEQEIPKGIWGVLYNMEIMFKNFFVNNDLGIANGIGRVEEAFKNTFGKLFGNEEWANYNFESNNPTQAQPTFFAGLKKAGDDAAEWFAKAFSKSSSNAKSLALNAGGNQNYGDTNINNTFTIGTVGESISLDDMVDKVSNAIKGMFTSPINGLQRSR